MRGRPRRATAPVRQVAARQAAERDKNPSSRTGHRESKRAESDLIRTGVYGLDDIFLGGVLKGNVILVEGAPGTGKTLLGVEFIYKGITEYNEPGVIVVFESAPQKLIRDAAGFGWNLDELQQQKKLKIIFTSPQVLYQELRSPDSLLLETAAELRAHRIFIDGISLLRTVSPGNGTPEASYRELLQQLGEGWHNTHHAFPTSARHGLRWWQFDVSYYVIRGLDLLGLAWNVKIPSRERQFQGRRGA